MKEFLLFGSLFLILSISGTCQERENDKRPAVQLLASLTSLVGWTKNDIGNWVSAPNALKSYEHSAVGTLKICDQTSKINLYHWTYRGKTAYCVVKFGTHQLVHAGRILTENTADYWIFDSFSPDTTFGADTTVMRIAFNTTHSGLVSNVQPQLLTINTVIDDMIVNFDQPPPLESQFGVECRGNKKTGKFQVLIGSYMASINTFEAFGCSAPESDNELKNLYYETPKSNYVSFFAQIK